MLYQFRNVGIERPGRLVDVLQCRGDFRDLKHGFIINVLNNRLNAYNIVIYGLQVYGYSPGVAKGVLDLAKELEALL